MICEPVPAAAVQLVPACEALPRAVIGRRVNLVIAVFPEPFGRIGLAGLVQLVRELHQLNVAINTVLLDNAAVRCRAVVVGPDLLLDADHKGGHAGLLFGGGGGNVVPDECQQGVSVSQLLGVGDLKHCLVLQYCLEFVEVSGIEQQAASEFQAELAFRGLALENRLSVHQLCIHGKTAARTLESDVNTVLISTEFANFQSPRSGKLKVSAQRIVERCLLVVRHHPEKLQRLLLAVHVFDFHGSAFLNDPSGTIAGIAKPCLCKCFIERPGTNPDRRQVAANDFPCSHGCYKSLHVAFPFHLTGE